MQEGCLLELWEECRGWEAWEAWVELVVLEGWTVSRGTEASSPLEQRLIDFLVQWPASWLRWAVALVVLAVPPAGWTVRYERMPGEAPRTDR